jgi:hypothetical protein
VVDTIDLIFLQCLVNRRVQFERGVQVAPERLLDDDARPDILHLRGVHDEVMRSQPFDDIGVE